MHACWRLFWMMLAVWLLESGARAEIRLFMPADAPDHTRQGWVPLVVEISGSAAIGGRIDVTLRDPRGGLTLVCQSEGGAGDRRVGMWMPWIEMLPPGEWELEAGVSVAGRQLERSRIRVLGAPGLHDAADGLFAARSPVIEPGLRRLGPMRAVAQVSGHVRNAVILTGPIAVVVVLLARGLFRRAWVVMTATAAGMALLTAGMLVYLRGAAQDATSDDRTAIWIAGPWREELSTGSWLFGGRLALRGAADEWLCPLAADTREYWGWRDLRLIIAGNTMRLEGPVRARQVISYLRRSEVPQRTPALRWPVELGYVRDASGQGKLLTAWAQELSRPLELGVRAWYELRFEAPRRYWVGQENGVFWVMEEP